MGKRERIKEKREGITNGGKERGRGTTKGIEAGLIGKGEREGG